jgi:predicted GNAT family acetyltransferase
MLSIEKSSKDGIENSQYKKHYDEENLYIIKEKGKQLAYISFKMKDDTTMWLYMIEVIEKGKGIGRKVIKYLNKHFSLERIEGFVLCEKRAYLFWESLGSNVYYIAEEGYDIDELIDAELESPFILDRIKM